MIRQTVLLFGPPGSGKGTQAKRLEKSLRSPHVSTGDMFRDHLGRRTELGLKVEHIMKSGQLVPDAVTNEMVRERLLRPDASLGVILDGFPRNVAQAKWLESFLTTRGYGVMAVIVIEVPDPELASRIKSRAAKEGRPDDADEQAIARRLDTYRKQTEASVGYYKAANVPVHVVNGVGAVEEVERRINSSLGLVPR